MTHPTCNVRCAIRDQAGNPAVGAEITAILNRAEVHDGYLIPARVSAVADAAGIAVLALWPNVLGATASAYQVLIKHPGGAVLRTTAVVPNLEHADLHLIAELPPHPGRLDGQLLIDSAISASQETLQQIQQTQAEVAEAMAGADAAIQQMTGHAATAEAAAEAAQAAAAEAAGAQAAATAEAAAAAQSAIAAAASENDAGTSAAEAADSASASGQSATAASASASAAAASQAAAADSATVAAGSAASASASAAAADLAVTETQSALTRIAADLIRTQTLVTEHHAFS